MRTAQHGAHADHQEDIRRHLVSIEVIEKTQIGYEISKSCQQNHAEASNSHSLGIKAFRKFVNKNRSEVGKEEKEEPSGVGTQSIDGPATREEDGVGVPLLLSLGRM